MRNCRLKQLATIVFSTVDKKTAESEHSVLLCNYTDVYYNERITPVLTFMEGSASKAEIRRFSLRQGDVLLTKDSETPDDIAASAYVPEDLPGVLCGYHLALLRPVEDVDGRYLHWALNARPVLEQFTTRANGITRFGLRQDSVADVRVPVPSAATQRAIADYLDTETARIDALIEKKRRMVELLLLRWRMTIDNLVAAQVNVPLRRLMASIVDGTHGTYERLLIGRPLLSAKNLSGGRVVMSEDESLISEGDYEEIVRSRRFHPGDTLLGVIGGSIGNVARLRPGDLLAFQRSVACLSPGSRYYPDFLYFVAQSSQFQAQMLQAANTSAQAGVYLDDLASIVVPLPSLAEQKVAAATLSFRCEKVNELEVCINEQVSLLQERRQGLITAAVTGELDIQGMAA